MIKSFKDRAPLRCGLRVLCTNLITTDSLSWHHSITWSSPTTNQRAERQPIRGQAMEVDIVLILVGLTSKTKRR